MQERVACFRKLDNGQMAIPIHESKSLGGMADAFAKAEGGVK